MIKTRAGVVRAAGKYKHKLWAPSPPGSPLIVYDELKQYGIRYSRKHLLDLMRESKFPAARQVGKNRVAWVRAEIQGYVDSLPVAWAAQPEDGDAAA
jgi:predicted DNA-binding transcriptional regulator AlpA